MKDVTDTTAVTEPVVDTTVTEPDRYIIEYRNGCRHEAFHHWAAIGDEYETPHTKSAACATLLDHRHDHRDEYRVTLLMADNTWADVTLAILGQIEADEEEAAREAACEDERHGWEQV